MQIPFNVIAMGITPGGVITPGAKIQNSIGCTVVGAGTGIIQITVDPEVTLNADTDMAVIAPGWGSSPSFGVLWGVSAFSGNVFTVTARQGDDQSLVDMPFGFFIVRMPKRN